MGFTVNGCSVVNISATKLLFEYKIDYNQVIIVQQKYFYKIEYNHRAGWAKPRSIAQSPNYNFKHSEIKIICMCSHIYVLENCIITINSD